MLQEQSVVLVKPDGIERKLIGEIISRFEKIGFKMLACKLVIIDKELAGKHYGYNDEWFENIGKKLLEFYKENGKDPKEEIGTMEPRKIGEIVQKWNVNYLTEGPVLAMLWQGHRVVEIIRKMVGSTYPFSSPPGTIRGDFSSDSPLLADNDKRAIKNLIHASGSVKEAQFEKQLWFKEKEIIK